MWCDDLPIPLNAAFNGGNTVVKWQCFRNHFKTTTDEINRDKYARQPASDIGEQGATYTANCSLVNETAEE